MAMRMATALAAMLMILAPATADAPVADRVKALVAQLGSPRWAERDAAQRGLLALGPLALPALKATASGAHAAEAASRLARLIRRWETRAQTRTLVLDRRLTDDALARELVGRPRVRRLVLRQARGLTDGALAAVAGLRDLRELELVDSDRLTDAGLGRLRGLRQLSLRLCRGLRGASLTRLTALESFMASHSALGALDLGGLERLRTLSLECTPIDDALADRIGQLNGLSRLRLVGCRGLTDAGIVPLTRLPLTHLTLVDAPQLTDAGLVRLAGCASLRRVALARCPELTTGAITGLAVALPALQRLNVRGCARAVGTDTATIKGLSRTRPPHGCRTCMMNLKMIGLAMVRHREQTGQLPALATLTSQLLASKSLTEAARMRCEETGHDADADGLAADRPDALDYVITPFPASLAVGSSERPVLWDRAENHGDWTHVLYADGHVECVTPALFERRRTQQLAVLRR